MNRREFLKLSASTAVVAAPISAVMLKQTTTSLATLKQKLKTTPLQTESELGNVFALLHCAQSIDMSITGYPEHKSSLFKATAGAAAFGIFGWFGAMAHNINEAIPSAPELNLKVSEVQALDQLVAAIERFEAYNGDFKPHFAYGSLNKSQYDVAHVLHIQDHFPHLVV